MTERKLSIERMPGKYEKRVFVGGDYDSNPSILREIKRLVRQTGFVPILASDFSPPKDEIHDYDMRLLHNCKNAIFEVTTSAGQLMELERCRDYNIQPLIVYQPRPRKEEPPHSLSSMVRTMGFMIQGWHNIQELKDFVQDKLRPPKEEIITEEDSADLLVRKGFSKRFSKKVGKAFRETMQDIFERGYWAPYKFLSEMTKPFKKRKRKLKR